MRSTPELVETIRARGGKVTPQRLLLYNLLEGNTSHPSAEALYERMRSSMPTVSLTTVYKTLNELVLTGDVKRFDVDGVAHFDPNTHPHAEAVCLVCGRISDVEVSELLAPQATTIPNFEVSAVIIYGYCQGCAQAALSRKAASKVPVHG